MLARTGQTSHEWVLLPPTAFQHTSPVGLAAAGSKVSSSADSCVSTSSTGGYYGLRVTLPRARRRHDTSSTGGHYGPRVMLPRARRRHDASSTERYYGLHVSLPRARRRFKSCSRGHRAIVLITQKSGNIFRVGISLDFASSSTRTPHGACVQMSGRHRIDPNLGVKVNRSRRVPPHATSRAAPPPGAVSCKRHV